MTDLTKIPLKEVQKLVTEDSTGTPVRIYATDGGGKYPIHGAVKYNEGWNPSKWTSTGSWHRECHTHEKDLKVPTRQPDFTKLPKDVLVKVGSNMLYTTGVPQLNGEIALFHRGGSSRTTATYSIYTKKNIKLMPGDWVVWDGKEECPLPKEVEVEIKFRYSEINVTANCTAVSWRYEDEKSDDDVIAYRITGKIL